MFLRQTLVLGSQRVRLVTSRETGTAREAPGMRPCLGCQTVSVKRKGNVSSKKIEEWIERLLFVQPLDEPEHRKEVGLLTFKRKRV